MARRSSELLPATTELLGAFGDRLRRARLRRELTAKQVAERAGLALMTFRSVERGGSGVTIGSYLAVMQVLGIEADLASLAASDSVGRELQDAKLPHLARTPPAQPREVGPPRRPAAKSDTSFTTSRDLAALVKAKRK
jgi:transcriptional regulator with XRE-family HTH domain